MSICVYQLDYSQPSQAAAKEPVAPQPARYKLMLTCYRYEHTMYAIYMLHKYHITWIYYICVLHSYILHIAFSHV